MQPKNSNGDSRRHQENVDVCPRCAVAVNLSQAALPTVTSGMIECPRCEWVGPVEIQVAEVNEAAE